MAITNLKTLKSFHWIPPSTTPSYKITVEKDGVEEDVTGAITMNKVSDFATESIGNFEFEIVNPNNVYSAKWTGNEIYRYYKDYNNNPTTVAFKGRIEKPSNRGFKLNIKGKSESNRLLGIKVTKSYSDIDTSDILKDVFATYSTWVNTDNINSSGVAITVNWVEKPLWECVQELCQAAGFDAYLNSSSSFQYFPVGSVKNTTDALVHQTNILEIQDFVKDLQQIVNRVVVYGAVIDGIQIIATSESDDADYGVNSDLGVKEEIVNEDSITSQVHAQELADYILDQKKDPPEVGAVKGFLLGLVRPGEGLNISAPYDGIIPGRYVIGGYEDKIDLNAGEFSTKVFINKEPRSISHVIKRRIENEYKKNNTTLNPEKMAYSYNFLFNEDSGTHSNTEIINGVLRPTSSSGTWISPTLTLPSNLNEVYPIIVGIVLSGAVVSVSGNNGITYETVTDKTKTVINLAKGSELVVKVVFSDATTEIDSLSMQYKL